MKTTAAMKVTAVLALSLSLARGILAAQDATVRSLLSKYLVFLLKDKGAPILTPVK